MEALEQAAYEVEVYENHIDILLSMHKNRFPLLLPPQKRRLLMDVPGLS
jgi:hypothetical protein